MKEPIIRTHNREIDDLFERYRRAPGSHVFAPLADAYRKLGLVEEALDICARGLSANPRYASGYVVQGKCQYDAGRADRAEESFKKVIEIDPQNLVALRYLGIIRAGCGDTDGARGYFERILTLDPGDKDIRQRLDAIREAAPVSANTLVEEIEQVLQPETSKPPVVERVEERVEEPVHAKVEEPKVVKAPTDDVIELPEVRDEFEGTPIVLGDEESVTTEYIATVTLADIFATQGYHEKALKIYHDVLRRQPNNDDVRRKITAIEKGEPIARPHEVGHDHAPAPRPSAAAPAATPGPVATPAPAAIALPGPAASPAAPGSPPVPTNPAGAAIDEGRSYEQFKRWLRTVSD
ncbi:MAG: tetratricopeptide repeat protein [Candidatus Latescibacteria bacterium]|nr:tetratricopeptide repeat protein [Candidatus Latescibacterota bacterium]